MLKQHALFRQHSEAASFGGILKRHYYVGGILRWHSKICGMIMGDFEVVDMSHVLFTTASAATAAYLSYRTPIAKTKNGR